MKYIISALILLLSLNVIAQSGQVYISVGKARAKKSLMALPQFKFLGGNIKSSSLRTGTEIYQAIKNDLDASGLFAFVSDDAFLESPKTIGLRPYPTDPNGFKFKNWSAIGTEFLIRGGYNVVGSNISIEVYLYHVPQAKVVFARNYKSPKSGARKLAHKLSNDIVESLTGKKAFFNSRIVVTANRDGNYKEIYTMDWDGYNLKRETTNKNISISPAWSPDNKTIGYTSYAYHPKAKSRNADLFTKRVDLNAKAKLVSYRKGINSGAHFHPNGEELFMTLSRSGNADIYRLNLTTNKLSSVTKGPRGAMNVEPAITKDGRLLAFSSDRSGRPMIYIQDLFSGKKPKRVTFAGKYNASPTWSPDGKKLAFAGFDKGHFDIFIMDADGTNMARLTSAKRSNGKAANNESPTFSPDGRFVMFSSNRTGSDQLYIVDVEGNNERRITKDNFNYEKPKWSGHID